MSFPKNFTWGCASAAYQIEGAVAEGGRQPSIWDTFSHSPGRVLCDHTGDVSTDHYHRYKEDVKLMAWLGLKAYRFSISWSRLLDPKTGSVNPAGADFYSRLIDELLAHGIAPWVTCFHWDLPQYFESEYGGWRSRETALRFGDYCAKITELFSDRVENYFTVNEFWNFTDGGYLWGVKAPGIKVSDAEMMQVRHHALLAHGLGVQNLRASAKRPIRVGVAEAIHTPVPIIASSENVEAAKKSLREENLFLHAMLEGTYPQRTLKRAAELGVDFPADDMPIIGEKLDFIGANCYAPNYVRAADNERGFETVPLATSHPTIGPDWLTLEPQILYWVPRLLKEVWDVNDVFLSENGCAGKDQLTQKGEILDTDRVMFLRNHLLAAERAIAEGWPLRGYFLWSILDNFEWSEGYTQRFGIVYVNYSTMERIPKTSGHWYREVIREGRVL